MGVTTPGSPPHATAAYVRPGPSTPEDRATYVALAHAALSHARHRRHRADPCSLHDRKRIPECSCGLGLDGPCRCGCGPAVHRHTGGETHCSFCGKGDCPAYRRGGAAPPPAPGSVGAVR